MYTSVVMPALLALAFQQGATHPPTALEAPTYHVQEPVSSQYARTAQPGAVVPDILAAAWSTDSVVRFDGKTGNFEGTFTIGGPLRLPSGLDYGPDGNLYVSSFYWSTILRYDGQTGEYIDTFVPSGSGGLSQPSLMKFRPDGLLYVLASYNGGVIRFDARTGALHDVFIPAGSGGITTAFAMAFGPDGDIYLGGYYSKTVVRFDGQTGAVKLTVAEYIDTPSGMAFGPDGMLNVGEWRTGSFFEHNIQRYTPDGEFLGKLTNLTQGPLELRFDKELLYVAGASAIDVLDGETGQWISSMYYPGVENLMALTFTQRPSLPAK